MRRAVAANHCNGARRLKRGVDEAIANTMPISSHDLGDICRTQAAKKRTQRFWTKFADAPGIGVNDNDKTSALSLV
jgi:hypothetical protein